ncbi:MAG: hypothetical protein LC791_07720, partial [Acidobacteria bacterium]|nr:hypothetical protein [Acidobacteriota bacterium]
TERRSPGPGVPLDQALPLVKRALKVLADREVTPQLGLLKSTLLQLDSSFSERDYGAGTFRDFAEKLAERGLVSLKHAGRSTHVELIETADSPEAAVASEAVETPAVVAPAADAQAPPARREESAPQARREESALVPLNEGVAMVRRVLFEAPSPPRWPLYLRQMKQFLRNGQPDFDERKYGSIVELMRACQKEGIVKVERDRQGGLRVFAGPSAYRTPSEPQQAWGLPDDHEVQALEDAATASLAAVDAAATESGLNEWREESGNGMNSPGELAQPARVEELEIEPESTLEPPAPPTRRPAARRKTHAPEPVPETSVPEAADAANEPTKPRRARKATKTVGARKKSR